MPEICRAIFVYGTLKRGQPRERIWPHEPENIVEAFIRATLVDLGPYPAIIDGDDLVAGELWMLPPADIDPTLAALDAVEGYRQGRNDLYERRVVSCSQRHGGRRDGHTYFFANPHQIAGKPVIAPDPDGYCRWRSDVAG